MNQVQFNQFWLEYERHFTACVQASPQRYDHTVEEAPLIARQVRERCLCEGISSLDIDSEGFRLTCRTLGIEHTCEAIEHFLSQGTASLSDLNTVDNPDQEVSPIGKATAERWARDWFAGSAYCPRCANDETIFVDGVSTGAESRIETWHCHRCTHSWKLEFRESAAAADSDAPPSLWIEREQIENDLSAKGKSSPAERIRRELDAAITRLTNAAFACGEWSSDSEERYDELYRESGLARRSLEALCARMCSGEAVAPAMEASPPEETSAVQ